MGVNEIKIVIGHIFLERENATDELDKLQYVNIKNEALRFLFFAVRAIHRRNGHISKNSVLNYIRKETTYTMRDTTQFTDLIFECERKALKQDLSQLNNDIDWLDDECEGE